VLSNTLMKYCEWKGKNPFKSFSDQTAVTTCKSTYGNRQA
jgi:hypothetical protein